MVHNIKSLPILADRYSCTGCLACVDTCPVGALKTIIDEEGFLTYSLNVKVCISCHKCESNCPIVSEYKYGENVVRSNIYAAWNLCDAERMQSASGGAFSAIASYFLSQSNTCVIGATQDGIKTRHIAITQKKDLYKIQGSKYAQSDTTGIYKLTYDKLKAGVKVLFSGTPCQVAGILSYIKSQDLINNLYTIDIVCGGVPSLFLIKNFVDNNPLGVSRIVSYRDKRTGWKSKGYKYRLVYEDKNFILHEENDKNLVIDGFSSGLANRYACNNCRFSYVERNSDFTIADLWGDTSFKSEHYKGLSSIVPHTIKANHLLKKLQVSNIHIEQISWPQVLLNNPRYACGTNTLGHALERKYLSDIFSKYSYDTICKIYALKINKYSLWNLYRVYRKLVSIICRVNQKKYIRKTFNI